MIPAWSLAFVEIDHGIISTANPLPSADSRRVAIDYIHPGYLFESITKIGLSYNSFEFIN